MGGMNNNQNDPNMNFLRNAPDSMWGKAAQAVNSLLPGGGNNMGGGGRGGLPNPMGNNMMQNGGGGGVAMGNGGRGGNRAKPRWMRELSASMGGGKALNSLFGGGGGNQNFGGVDGRALPNNGAVDGDWLAKGRAAKDAFFANIDNPLNNMQMPGMPGGGDGMQQGNNNPMMGNNMGNMMPSDLTKQLPNVIGLAVLCIGLTTTVGSLQGGGGVHQTLDREEISRLSRSESSSSSSSSGRNNLRSISAAYKKPSSSSSSE